MRPYLKSLPFEDVNLNSLRGWEGYIPDELQVFDPGSITVGAAIIMAFK